MYKTHLSEAVYGLGVDNVRRQIGWTVLSALVLGGHLALSTGRLDIVGWVVVGLVVGGQYSLGPVRAKGRGVLQVLTLSAVIFIGPMILIARIVGEALTPELLGFFVAYAAMQEGIILVNTAEDVPEDEAAGIRTSAVALGLPGALALATAMVAVGGLGILGSLVSLLPLPEGLWAVAPLSIAWVWVLRSVGETASRVRGVPRATAMTAVRASARRMPLWITATAWSTLFAAVIVWLTGVG